MTTTFGRIEMPPAIARLPRDTATPYPVPYVAEWHDQEMILPPLRSRQFGMELHLTPHVDGPANLGFMCPDRQRRCMLEMVCQVCGTSLRRRRRFMAGGSTVEWFNEPPVCRACMAFALRVCPGLVTGRGSGHLRVWEARTIEYRQMRTGITVYPEYYTLEDGPQPRSILHFIQARLADADVYTPDEWLAKYQNGLA